MYQAYIALVKYYTAKEILREKLTWISSDPDNVSGFDFIRYFSECLLVLITSV